LDTSDATLSNFADKRSSDSGQILHGNKKFTSNRWFDKTIQVKLSDFTPILNSARKPDIFCISKGRAFQISVKKFGTKNSNTIQDAFL
jgi:hypothetical protein